MKSDEKGLSAWVSASSNKDFFGLERSSKSLEQLRPNVRATKWERFVFWMKGLFR